MQLLIFTKSSHLQMLRAACLWVTGAEARASNSSGMQLPAVAQLQLASSPPEQITPGQQAALTQQALAQAHQALMQQNSLAVSASAPPSAPAATEMPRSSEQATDMQHVSSKHNMMQAIADGSAMIQVCHFRTADTLQGPCTGVHCKESRSMQASALYQHHVLPALICRP